MSSATAITPRSVVIVRDEEWLVTKMETADEVTLLSVQGLSEFVRSSRVLSLIMVRRHESSKRRTICIGRRIQGEVPHDSGSLAASRADARRRRPLLTTDP